MLIHPFKESFRAPFQEAFVALGTIIYPPIPEDLQIWLKGNDNGTDQKLDSWLEPDAENFEMLQSACPNINGVDEYAKFSRDVILSGNFETSFEKDDVSETCYYLSENNGGGDIIYSRGTFNLWQVRIDGVTSNFTGLDSAGQGTVTFRRTGNVGTLSYKGVDSNATVSTSDFTIDGVSRGADRVQGKVYNLRLKDDTQDYSFRMAESSGLISYSDNYDTDGLSLAWTADSGTLWADTQDTYHGNAVGGWWEIYGNDVMSPYPAPGYDEHHKGGTFNDAETSFAPEEFFVGTANGVDHTITMLADHGSIVSHGLLDTSTPTYVHPTISLTAGIIRHILFSDGTLIKIDEGEGTDIHDADGNIVGTMNGDPVAFYSGAKMVSEAVIAMEAAADAPVYTDGSGHAVPLTQADFEASLEINNNKQYYFTNCPGEDRELVNYKTPRSAAEDLVVLIQYCLTHEIQFDGQALSFDNNNVYMR